METDSQKFCLRWNNHQTNMIQFFDELRKNQDFTDVTLMSDTQEVIRCHKIVLAAGSFYFERVFHHIEPDQSTLVLTNTDFALLESLIMFMYRGEIHVHQDDLKALLKAAERLEVKGLNNFKDKTQLESSRIDEIPSPFLEQRSPPPSTTPRPKIEKNPQLPSPLSHADLYNLHVSNQAVNTISSQGIWPIPAFPFSQHPYHSHYSALSRSYIHNSDTSPLTKKKMISSASMASTPILRTALVGQGVVGKAHSTSGSNLDNVDNGSGSNGSANENDRRYSTDFSANEDPSSPHTDMEDDERKHSPRSRRNSFNSNAAPKEWKRYKQYTREDINAAIDVVKAGEMSALRASRRFNVPSRTLYDKVKKLGIKTQRHSGRHSSRNGNGIGHRIENDSARFPYGVGGNSDGSIYRNSYGMVNPTELIMNMKHSSPSPKAQPLSEDDNLENMVEDLSIKNRQENGGIHPFIPKDEFKGETSPPNESYNS